MWCCSKWIIHQFGLQFWCFNIDILHAVDPKAFKTMIFHDCHLRYQNRPTFETLRFLLPYNTFKSYDLLLQYEYTYIRHHRHLCRQQHVCLTSAEPVLIIIKLLCQDLQITLCQTKCIRLKVAQPRPRRLIFYCNCSQWSTTSSVIGQPGQHLPVKT